MSGAGAGGRKNTHPSVVGAVMMTAAAIPAPNQGDALEPGPSLRHWNEGFGRITPCCWLSGPARLSATMEMTGTSPACAAPLPWGPAPPPPPLVERVAVARPGAADSAPPREQAGQQQTVCVMGGALTCQLPMHMHRRRSRRSHNLVKGAKIGAVRTEEAKTRTVC